MSLKELRQKSQKDLTKNINDLKAELFMLRFKNSTGQLKELHKIDAVKKEIAKVLTVMNELKRTDAEANKVAKKASAKPATKKTSSSKKTKPAAKKVTEEVKEKDVEIKGESK